MGTVVVACGSASRGGIDAIAAEYVRLARVEDGHGAEYLEAVANARSRLQDIQEQDGRRAFLLAQLHALERRAKVVAGERIAIRDEAATLGMTVPAYDATRAEDLRAELQKALPGAGTLPARLAAHRRANAVPRSSLDTVASRSVEECRARTPPLHDVPDGGVELRYVVDTPWPAYTNLEPGTGNPNAEPGTRNRNRNRNLRSVVALRRDVAWLEDDLLAVVCHETYPGHHVQQLIWSDLRMNRGWQEFAVTPMFTPLAVMAERAANAATLLVVSREERSAVSRILDDFAPLALSTAVAVADGELDRRAGIARLRDELLMPDPEGFLAFVTEYRAMAVAYVSPLPEMKGWSEYLSLLRSPERLVGSARR
jgi:hypothetical protein